MKKRVFVSFILAVLVGLLSISSYLVVLFGVPEVS